MSGGIGGTTEAVTTTTRREPSSIRAKGNAPNTGLESGENVSQTSRRDLPHTNLAWPTNGWGLIVADRGGQVFAVGAEGDLPDTFHEAIKLPNDLLLARIPED